MFRISWRETLLVITIVGIGLGWFWHQRTLSKELSALGDRLSTLEREANSIFAMPSHRPAQGTPASGAMTGREVPDHSGVSPFHTLYLEE
jgi:hypothetical protein